VAFFVAVGCPLGARGQLYAYSGDNIASESAELVGVDAAGLHAALLRVNSIDGPYSRMNRGLAEMRPFILAADAAACTDNKDVVFVAF
jgi:hypothetical protein